MPPLDLRSSESLAIFMNVSLKFQQNEMMESWQFKRFQYMKRSVCTILYSDNSAVVVVVVASRQRQQHQY